jgi:cytochrome oxidase Cu insertion factor (SCO1/SenC/PrrC family)
LTSLPESQSRLRFFRIVLWGLIGLTLIVIVSISVMRLWRGGTWQAQQADLQVLGVVPDFVLLERSGRQVSRADLLGKVWVVNFIFTRCVDECPLESSQMARLQTQLASEDGVRWVSITLDPVHDTSDVLQRYAENFGAHPQRWLFLTGDKKAIYQLAQEGFHLGVIDPDEARRTSASYMMRRLSQAMQHSLHVLQARHAWAHHPAHPQTPSSRSILHSARFVLVDRHARIRGYYDSREATAMQRLQRHLVVLLQEDTK